MVFHEWSPFDLVDRYNKMSDIDFFRDEKKLLIALTTNEEMKPVWAMIYRNKSYFSNAHCIFINIRTALIKARQPVSTVREDILKYQTIALKARELSCLVKSTMLDMSPLNWFTDESISVILEHDINPDKADGYFCLVNDIDERHKKGNVYHAVNLSGKDECWKAAENTHDFFNKIIITPKHPCLNRVLQNIAVSADKQAAHQSKRKRIAKNKDTSEVTKFIRAFLPNWLEIVKTPHKRTLATLCRVVFDDPSIDEDTVSSAIKP